MVLTRVHCCLGGRREVEFDAARHRHERRGDVFVAVECGDDRASAAEDLVRGYLDMGHDLVTVYGMSTAECERLLRRLPSAYVEAVLPRCCDDCFDRTLGDILHDFTFARCGWRRWKRLERHFSFDSRLWPEYAGPLNFVRDDRRG